MNIVVLIQRQSLLIFSSDLEAPVPCVIPKTAINNLEIVNEKELDTFISKVLPSAPPKSSTQAILLLDDAICFSYRLEKGKEEENKKILLNDVPFSHVANTVLPLETGLVLVTTNKDLYDAVGRVLEDKNYSIVSVYPWAVLPYAQILRSGETFGPIIVKRLFDAVPSLRTVSFEYQTRVIVAVPDVSTPSTKPIATKKLSMGWIIFISVSGVYVLIMIALVFIRQ